MVVVVRSITLTKAQETLRVQTRRNESVNPTLAHVLHKQTKTLPNL